jgi:hypothetical protein
MQQWEYLFLVCFQDPQLGWRPRYVNNQEIPNWRQGASVPIYVNQLGTEGWELVSVYYAEPSADQSTNYRLFFKRPASTMAPHGGLDADAGRVS